MATSGTRDENRKDLDLWGRISVDDNTMADWRDSSKSMFTIYDCTGRALTLYGVDAAASGVFSNFREVTLIAVGLAGTLSPVQIAQAIIDAINLCNQGADPATFFASQVSLSTGDMPKLRAHPTIPASTEVLIEQTAIPQSMKTGIWKTIVPSSEFEPDLATFLNFGDHGYDLDQNFIGWTEIIQKPKHVIHTDYTIHHYDLDHLQANFMKVNPAYAKTGQNDIALTDFGSLGSDYTIVLFAPTAAGGEQQRTTIELDISATVGTAVDGVHTIGVGVNGLSTDAAVTAVVIDAINGTTNSRIAPATSGAGQSGIGGLKAYTGTLAHHIVIESTVPTDAANAAAYFEFVDSPGLPKIYLAGGATPVEIGQAPFSKRFQIIRGESTGGSKTATG